MSKYTIVKNEYGSYDVKEKTRTHTGRRWLTMENTIEDYSTLEMAQKMYPKAIYKDEGEIWFDRLTQSQNMPSNGGY